MVKVKICGIRRDEDVRMMNILSPDYIGIIIGCPFSSRSVDFETAGKLFSEVRNGIGKVGVFVDMDEGEVIEFLLSGSADIAQLHGNESNQYIRKIQARTGARKKPKEHSDMPNRAHVQTLFRGKRSTR